MVSSSSRPCLKMITSWTKNPPTLQGVLVVLNVNHPLDGLYNPINGDKLPFAHVDVHPFGAHFLKILTVPPPAMARGSQVPQPTLRCEFQVSWGTRLCKEPPQSGHL